jgi:hypothetical protein
MILKPQFLLETYAMNPQKVWADEASSGTHAGRTIIKQILPQRVQAQKARVGEASEENSGWASNFFFGISINPKGRVPRPWP